MSSVAEIIRSHHAEIVAMWAAEAQGLASGRSLEGAELLNIMPEYVASLAEPDALAPGSRPTQLIERHLAGRIREGFRLDEMIAEIEILGRCVASFWTDAPPPERPDAADVERLADALRRASTTITDAFTHHMRDDEQTEKRFLRQLQSIASEALGAPPSARLDDMLNVVMAAMDAQTAALLLCDHAAGTLTTVAAAGLARGELARYTTRLEAPSFEAAVAAREQEPTAVEDLATTPLAVSDALREKGIRALVGVRLPIRERLRGVLYVGVREARSFSPRELRRIEAFGEQLARHLESAELYANLRALVAEMETERAMRERFVSVLAHDLRGPLHVARLGAQVLAGDAARLGEHRGIPARVVRSIDRADRMVRDLLDALLIRAGRPLPLQLAYCDLVTVARDVVDELDGTRRSALSLRGDDEVLGWWSPDDLRRAIWNLATNAIKYGAEGAPVVVAVQRRGGGAEVSVHNRGEAIPLADRRRLFEPFTQRQAHGEGRHGWGLGLTLVQGCAAAHGGRVEVESTPADGTTFTIRLPLDARPFVTGGDAQSAPR